MQSCAKMSLKPYFINSYKNTVGFVWYQMKGIYIINPLKEIKDIG